MSKKKYAPLIYYLKCLYLPHYLLIFYPHLFLATKVPSIFDEGNFLFVVESREALWVKDMTKVAGFKIGN